MSIIEEGKKAPAFKLKDKSGEVHNLKDILADYTVLYFYPKDSTPGCTLEARDFSKLLSKFEKLNVSIVGISGGDEKSKQKFCDKYKLKILLLSDENFAVSKKYGVYGEKQFMGKKFMGISRVTFILDSKGKIIKVYDKVKVIGHAKEVFGFLKGR